MHCYIMSSFIEHIFIYSYLHNIPMHNKNKNGLHNISTVYV